jgi:hypothetical protein
MASSVQNILKKSYLTKLIFFLFIISVPFVFADCGSSKKMTAKEKSDKVKNKLDKKKEREYEKAREKAIKAHYERQGPKTRARMERRAAESKAWRQRHSDEPSFWVKVKSWFRRLFRKLDRPEKGLDDDITR